MELESDTDANEDTSPFEDFINIAHNHDSGEREELIEHFLQEDDLSEEEAQQKADAILLPKMKKTLKSIFFNYRIGMTDKYFSIIDLYWISELKSMSDYDL